MTYTSPPSSEAIRLLPDAWPGKALATRRSLGAVLWGQAARFRLNDDALAWLSHAQLAGGVVARLRDVLPWELSLSDADLTTRLREAGIVLREAQHQQVWDALFIAAYHAQEDVPIVRQLLSDDASVYHLLTDEQPQIVTFDTVDDLQHAGIDTLGAVARE